MNSNKTINILGGRDYRLPGGIETYYYSIAKANPHIHFTYWITTRKQDRTEFVREEIANMTQRKFLEKYSRNIYIDRLLKIKKYYKMSDQENQIWWVTNQFASIFLFKKKFFEKNQVFLFQHSSLRQAGFTNGLSGFLTKIFKKLGIFKTKLNNVPEFYFLDIITVEKFKKVVFPQIANNKLKYGIILEKYNLKNKINKNRQNDLIFIGRTYFKDKRFDKFLELINNKEFNDKKIVVVGEDNIKGADSYRYLNHNDILDKLQNTKFIITTSSEEGYAICLWEAIQLNTQVILFGTAEIFQIFKKYKGFHFAEKESDVIKIINEYKYENVSDSFDKFLSTYGFTSSFGINAPALGKPKYKSKAKLK